MSSICLIFIYNHRFDKNIEKLETMYKGRFSNIFHLVPFYDGSKENVIPVYETSFYFQGYIPQAIHRFWDEKYTHYFFVGDDVLLHPQLNENNLLEKLSVNDQTCFFPDLWESLDKRSYSWVNTFPALNAFYLADALHHHSINWKSHFPPREEAIKRFSNQGISIGKIQFRDFRKNAVFPTKRKALLHYLKLVVMRRRSLPYPMATGYSDIFLLPATEMKSFAHLCEITRQMRLWVEVAIPTIAISTLKNIKFEKDAGVKGTTYWANDNEQELRERESVCDFKLSKLYKTFKHNELYIRPIKLSKWNINE